MLPQKFIDEMKQRLLETKAQLENELKNSPAFIHMGDDLESNSDEVNVDEVNQDIHAVAKADLEKINAALKKIEHGSYGTDDEGEEISEQRLRALPWADKSL